MSGILEIESLKDHLVTQFSYSTLNQLDSQSKKNIMNSIYTQRHLKQVSLRCLCKPDLIKMTIAYIEEKDAYYLRSSSNQSSKHAETCHFYKKNSISSDSTHENGWKVDDKGYYSVSLNAHDYKLRDRKQSKEPSTASPLSLGEIGISTSKASLNQLVKFLVTQSWNLCIRFDSKKEYPTLTHVFNKIFHTTSRKILVTKELSLHQVLFKKGKIGTIYHLENEFKKKAQPFVLLLLDFFVELIEESSFVIHARNPITQDLYKFTAPFQVMDHASRAVSVSDGPFIIGGFVKNKGFGKSPEFISLSMLPINKNGVPIESSFEREVYDQLCDEQRLIERPIESKYYPKWNGLIPDGLLLDTTPETIIEIFGMSESNKEYHLHRKFKIDHYNSLKPRYELWYWDAFNGSEKPILPS